MTIIIFGILIHFCWIILQVQFPKNSFGLYLKIMNAWLWDITTTFTLVKYTSAVSQHCTTLMHIWHDNDVVDIDYNFSIGLYLTLRKEIDKTVIS